MQEMATTLMLKALPWIGRARGDAGQDLIEYGLLMALIAIVAMAGVTALGRQIDQVMWQAIVNNF